ncbi:M3 family metallopeptidase [Solidesulfovibrio sp.]|uniref:M3 family metallopeptidase n=1 Tax=Solidesulfovibrio sp. TaxID=2910990 RepID=UPI002616E21E|nr:M3 family metallopeptidase [Solidesulfovibrio sp.]
MADCIALAQETGRALFVPESFPALLREREELLARTDRIAAYAELLCAASSPGSDAGALRQRVEIFERRVKDQARVFELAWAGLDEPTAKSFLAALGEHPAGHNLAKFRRFGPHLLDPGRETLLSNALWPARSAWLAQWRDLAGMAQAGRLLGRLSHPRSSTRASAARALGRGLRRHRALFAGVLWGLLLLERLENTARNHPHWSFRRAVEEETTPRAVDGLVAGLRRGFPLVGRYFRLKARLLGLGVLAAHDCLTPPVPGLGRAVSWPAAQRLALAALGRIAPALAGRARVFFEQERIDAPPRPGKAPGAFCRGLGPGEVPFILLNASGRPRDVAVLVHELGHGLHHLLSDGLGPTGARPPFALSEAVAVCGELALSEERLARARSDKARLAALCLRLEDDITTIFRQAALHAFEHEIHLRETLTGDDCDTAWLAVQEELYQGAVTGHEPSGWAVTPHFFVVPGYVHIYARAGCLAWALWKRREAMGVGFGAAFTDLCAAGGSRSLAALLEPFGLDPDAPDLACTALECFEANLDQAEQLAGGL